MSTFSGLSGEGRSRGQRCCSLSSRSSFRRSSSAPVSFPARTPSGTSTATGGGTPPNSGSLVGGSRSSPDRGRPRWFDLIGERRHCAALLGLDGFIGPRNLAVLGFRRARGGGGRDRAPGGRAGWKRPFGDRAGPTERRRDRSLADFTRPRLDAEMVAVFRLADDPDVRSRPTRDRRRLVMLPESDAGFAAYVRAVLDEMPAPTADGLGLRLRACTRTPAWNVTAVVDRPPRRGGSDVSADGWWLDDALPAVTYDDDALIVDANEAAKRLLGSPLIGHSLAGVRDGGRHGTCRRVPADHPPGRRRELAVQDAARRRIPCRVRLPHGGPRPPVRTVMRLRP